MSALFRPTNNFSRDIRRPQGEGEGGGGGERVSSLQLRCWRRFNYIFACLHDVELNAPNLIVILTDFVSVMSNMVKSGQKRGIK